MARSSWWSFIKEVGLKLDVKLGEGREQVTQRECDYAFTPGFAVG